MDEQIKILINEVSRLCDVPPNAILSKKNKRHFCTFPRWLLWFSIKNLTHFDNNTIGRLSSTLTGETFGSHNVQYGIKKMAYMVDNDCIWAKRWGAIKSTIKEMKKDSMQQELKTQKILLVIPKGIEVEIKEK